MHILIPHMSCVVTEQEFEDAVKQYPDVYVVNAFGKILRHLRLRGDRFVRTEVKEIPGLSKEKLVETSIGEEVKFLPNGKVPSKLLTEIIQFFRDVMTIKKAEQEAMAHVLWNEKDKDSEDLGYRIAIPNQVVGKASVRYEHDHIEPGDIIVLDIHSHNTMSAFFSGTDDNDDKKGIFYSAVVGDLDRREPTIKWRLNVNESKKDAVASDVFEIQEIEVKIPSEWLDKVKTQEWSSPVGKYQPPVGGWEAKNTESGSRSNRSYSNARAGGYRSWEHGVSELYDSDAHESIYGGTTPISSDVSKSSETQVETRRSPIVVTAPGKLSTEEKSDLKNRGVTVEEVESLSLFNESNEYSANAAQHGKAAAEAYDQISAYLQDLENVDELLLNIMTKSYQLLSYAGQNKLNVHGIA